MALSYPEWTPTPATQVKPLTPMEWIWYGYIATNKITFISGMQKAGKTTLLCHLLRDLNPSVPTRPTLITPVHGADSVLYVSEEDPDIWEQRIREYSIGDYVNFIHHPMRISGASSSLDLWNQFLMELALHAKELPGSHKLVVIDTISRVAPIYDINSNTATRQIMDPLSTFTDLGLAVLVVHHDRKNSTGNVTTDFAGSIDHQKGVDVVISFSRRPNTPFTDRVRFMNTISRFSRQTPDRVVLTLSEDGAKYHTVIEDEYGNTAPAPRQYGEHGGPTPESSVVRMSRNQCLRLKVQQVLPCYPPGLTAVDVADVVKQNSRRMREFLDEGYADGKWDRTGTGDRGDPLRYYLKLPVSGMGGPGSPCSPGSPSP